MQETIYTGGPIITMESDQLPEAILVQDGTITGIGARFDLQEVAPNARVRDLQGRTLLPAFMDAHSHITSFAATLGLVQLAGVRSFGEIATRTEEFLRTARPEAGSWVSGFGYDHNTLAEKAHPTKDLLDKISPDSPLLFAHASGHMGVCNSAALAALGITADTPNPKGGKIGRIPGSKEPSGYLEETAFTLIGSQIPQPPLSAQLRALDRAQEIYLSYGIATAQDGLTRSAEWTLLSHAAEAGRLKLDVVSYLDLMESKELAQNKRYWKDYANRLKIGGYKIFLDGSPQGRTAWMSNPYLPEAGEDAAYCGYPIHDAVKVKDFMVQALQEDAQLLCHCNGDAAAQQMLDVYRDAMQETKRSGIRPVMIHAQLLRRNQLPELAELGIIASFFVAHTRHWGDVHLKNFGKERADFISPVQSAIQNKVLYTFHQDTPVLPPDMLDTIQCAVQRTTENGVPLAPEERISVYDALRGVTINVAKQYFEEERKGSISVGKAADFVLLDQNPLAVPVEQLRSIRVLETIKDGRVLYTAAGR